MINKDMLIIEIFSAFPDKAAEIAERMFEIGLHCVGCGSAQFETLADGMLAHGFSDEQIDSFVEELNHIIS